jgi:site-specific DNA recombinase
METATALYARVSSEKQAEEKTIESQLAELREYASAQGYRVEPELIFSDNGVSGATLDRPGLDSLRDAALAGAIERVLVLCPDRLARKHAVQLVLIEELKRLGVEIEFKNQKLSDNPEGELLLNMQGVIAEYEREKIMERSRRGKVHRAQQGQVSVLSGAPYGYVYTAKREGTDARYDINKSQAAVVKKIFQMYVMERKAMNAIAKHLNEQEIASPKGRKWLRSTVYKILRNPAYMGKAAYKKHKATPRTRVTKLARDGQLFPKQVNSSRVCVPEEQWIYIPVPRIVSEKMFRRAHEQMAENVRFSRRNNTRHQYLLSGLLRCKECGYTLSGITTSAKGKKTSRSYYACTGSQGYRFPEGKECSSHYIRCEVLDELVWQQMKELLEKPELVMSEYEHRCDRKSREGSNIETITSKKQRELRAHNTERERLLDLYQHGHLSLETISERLEAIKIRTEKTKQEYALMEKEARQEHSRL